MRKFLKVVGKDVFSAVVAPFAIALYLPVIYVTYRWRQSHCEHKKAYRVVGAVQYCPDCELSFRECDGKK